MNAIKGKKMDLGTASLTLIVAFCAQYLFQVIVGFFPLSDAAYTWTVVIANQLILFAVCFVFCFKKKVDYVDLLGLKRPPKWYFFPIFFFVAVACLFAFAPLSGLIKRMLEKLGYVVSPNYYVPMHNAGLFALSFLALTLLPAIGEETALRGVLFGGSRERSPVFAIFYTAAIFALMHGNLNQLAHQFFLGVVMGYLVCVTGSIYASATVHFFNNGLALLFEYGLQNGWIDPRFYWYLCGELSPKTTLIGMVIAIFAIVMLLVLVTCLLIRERAKKETETEMHGNARGISAYLNYLAGIPTEEKSEENAAAKAISKKIKKYSLALAIALAAMLLLVVLLSLVPTGGKG